MPAENEVKISALGTKTSLESTTDFIPVVDTSDTTQAASGSTAKATPKTVLEAGYGTLADWVARGGYGHVAPGSYSVTSQITTGQTYGSSLYGFGAPRSDNESNHNASAATVFNASGLGSGESVIEVRRENFEFANFTIRGKPTHASSATPADYLITLYDVSSGIAKAGNGIIRHVTFAFADGALLRLGKDVNDNHTENLLLDQCFFAEAPIGIQVNNTKSMLHPWRHLQFLTTPICIEVNAGGSLQLDSPLVTSADSILIKNNGSSSNNCSYVVTNPKFDDQAEGAKLYVSGAGMHRGHVLVNGGQVSYDGYETDGDAFCVLNEGQTINFNSFWNLQPGMFRWQAETSGTYGPAVYNLFGCALTTSSPGDLLDAVNSTLGADVSLKWYGCTTLAGTPITDGSTTDTGEL